MCGIAGIIYKNREKQAEADKIIKMTNAIAHRGPDAEGFFVEKNIALGHRRLSIIDLTEEGNQPMFSHDNRYVIVYNGEIYNYREMKADLQKQGAIFRNHTDTEVIIEAYRFWGQDCVKRFNGMWAFCLYDKEKEECFFSRDRFAVKPLVILDREDVFVFASEAKAILAAFPEENLPDYDMVFLHLWEGTPEDKDEKTFYRNIKRFEQSTNMLYSLKDNLQSKKKYWEVDEALFREKWVKGNNPFKTFRCLLEDAVQLRIQADVEVGSCLSGGLDSSTMVGISSKKYGKKIHTFSSVYLDREYSEKEYVEAVNDFCETNAHLIYPDAENKELLDTLKKIMYYHDGPFAGAALYSQYSVLQGVKGVVKVVLDGQGADELLAGYIPYYTERIMDLLEEDTICARLSVKKMLSILQREWPSVFNCIPSDEIVNLFGVKFYRKICSNRKQHKVMWKNGDYPWITEEFMQKANKRPTFMEMPMSSNLNRRLSYDALCGSIPQQLHNEDGNSMAHSIETRLPFLDYRLVEFCLALDGKYKIKNEWTKWILRKSCRKYLPAKVAKRKNKMGFPTPFARWLRECDEKEKMKEIIYAFGERNIVPKKTLDYYYQQHMRGEADWSGSLFKVMILELWLRTCIA